MSEDTKHRRMHDNRESDELYIFGEALCGRREGSVERTEAAGQVEFVNSTQLPCQGCFKHAQALEAMGIKLGERAAANSLFRDAILPPGWVKRATDHPLWSEVIDDKGEVRLNIFYKAAFYDRHAFINVVKE